MYKDFKICKDCTTKCNVCENIGLCKECAKDYYLVAPNTCVAKCPDQYRLRDKNCEKCNDNNCLKCDPDVNTCKDCKAPHILLNGQCVNSCPDGYIANRDFICEKCNDINCLSCNPKDICIKCNNPYLTNNKGKCVLKCPDNYSPIEGKCAPCADIKCKKCSIGAVTPCLNCEDDHTLENTKCIPILDCEAKNKINFEGNCVNCPTNCAKCDNPKTCNTCKVPFILDASNQCRDKCDSGMVDVNGECKKCTDPRCSFCQKELSPCLTCQLGTYLKNGICVTECEKGYYMNVNSRTCEPCDSKCSECSKQVECKTCKTNFFLFEGKCIEKCPKGYKEIGNTCVPCKDVKCSKCDSTLEKCIDCDSPYLKNDDACVNPCPVNRVPENGICVPCKDNCSLCHSNKDCDKCEKGFFMYKGVCIIKCADKTVADEKFNCLDCKDPFCKNCDGNDTTKCINCLDNNFLYKNKCYPSCPVKTYPSPNNRCFDCDERCAECKTAKECTKCEIGFILTKTLDGAICTTSTCINGQVAVNGTCDPTGCVDNNCNYCHRSHPNICITCKDNYFLKDNFCVNPCQPGFYGYQKKCQPCATNCKQCDYDKCIECFNGYYFLNGTCVKCTDPMNVIVGKDCKTCDVPDCMKCNVADSNSCNKCRFPKVLLSNGKCSSVCNDGFYKQGEECLPCIAPCLKCLYKNQCITCTTGNYLTGNVCGPCSSGYKPNSQGKCITCKDPNCNNCKPDTPEECKECTTNYFLYLKKCYSNCVIGTYADNVTGQCKPCPEYCPKCTSLTACSECPAPLKKQNQKCVKDCDIGYTYYKLLNECKPCTDYNCKKCTLNNICIECKPPSILNKLTDKCGFSCPYKFFISKENDLLSCQPCLKECATCNSTLTCTSCDDGYFWFNNNCIQTCPEKTTPYRGTCIPCSSTDCSVCKNGNPNLCDICNQGYIPYNGICYKECPSFTFKTIFNGNLECLGKLKFNFRL